MATVQTATGPVDASKLGFTLSHEHTVMGAGSVWPYYPGLVDWEQTEQRVIETLRTSKENGIDSLIDLSTPDLGRNAAFMRRVSEVTGFNIIVGTGTWRDIPRMFWDKTPEWIAHLYIEEITNGVEGTGIKAGVIKVANDIEGVTATAELVLRAAAIACRETGTPISTHHWAMTKVGTRQSEVLLEGGTPPHLVCIGHSADTTDVEYLESLLKLGVYLSMDRYPGRDPRPFWPARNETVTELCRRGWAGRLMLGHDRGTRAVVRGLEAEHDPRLYLFLKETAIPDLLQRGVTEEQIRLMTVEVPARFLSGAEQLPVGAK